MKKSTVYLICSVLAAFVFVGFLGETEPQELLGFSISIWVYRAAWLVIGLSAFGNYRRLRRAEAQ